MILRKPYAFFIRMFKPVHIAMASMTIYLLYLENKILSFLSNYIYSAENVVGQKLRETLFSNYIYIFPIIILFFSLLTLGIMLKKKKPITFYMVNIFAYVVVLVINVYTNNFLGVLEKSIVSIKIAKLMHDLVFIAMAIETVSFIFLIVRGIGINFKRFDFDSEISKFSINESDKEEFEVNVNVDINESRTNFKRKLRKLKYRYLENKILVNLCICIFIGLISALIVVRIISQRRYNKEGIVYETSTFNFSVNNSYLLNKDFRNNKITDNYLVVVSAKLQSNFSSKSLYVKDFSLEIGEAVFKATTKYANNLLDLGTTYKESILTREFVNYLFVYEIPEKFMETEMDFSYNDMGNKVSIRLNPKRVNSSKISVTKKVGESISFKELLGDIEFKINSFDISDKYSLEYNYCIKKDDCVKSYEYLKPSIDKNYDKYILRVNVEFSDKSELNTKSFYDFFSRFGSIYYKIGDEWYSQNSGFEQIVSNKTNTQNNEYIGINSIINDASSIKLVFNIRDSAYEYVLR